METSEHRDFLQPELAAPAPFRADGPVSAAAIAALRVHPRLPDAMRSLARDVVALYQGNRLLNLLLNDRGRFLIGYAALVLHFGKTADDPGSGLTAQQMKTFCVEHNVCSRGRAEAMLALMRMSGYLAPDPEATDRRFRVLVPTERLIGLTRRRWAAQFKAIALLRPEGDAALRALDREDFVRAFVRRQGDYFRAGVRILDQAPALGLFADRNAGLMVLFMLLLAGEPDDTVPPSRPVPVSISALARRFGVSRPHVLKLLRDAEQDGFIRRVGTSGEQVVLLPRLREATQDFFATVFLFVARCAGEALDAAGNATAR
jgi:hypothetical protein